MWSCDQQSLRSACAYAHSDQSLCLLEYIEYIVAVSKNRCFKFADITFKLVDNLMVFLKEFVEKVDFEEKNQTTKNHTRFPSRQRVQPDFLVK